MPGPGKTLKTLVNKTDSTFQHNDPFKKGRPESAICTARVIGLQRIVINFLRRPLARQCRFFCKVSVLWKRANRLLGMNVDGTTLGKKPNLKRWERDDESVRSRGSNRRSGGGSNFCLLEDVPG